MAASRAVRRILFCDVDGVVNPLGRFVGFDDWYRMTVWDGTRVWVSPALGNWFGRLRTGGVEVVWASTWVRHRDALDEYAEALGLPEGLPAVDYVPMSDVDLRNCGKGPAVETWLSAHVDRSQSYMAVWVDDELGPDDVARAARLGIATVRTDPDLGLSDPFVRERIVAALGTTTDTTGVATHGS